MSEKLFTKKSPDRSNMAMTAVALQDHLSKSLSLGVTCTRKNAAPRRKSHSHVKAVVDSRLTKIDNDKKADYPKEVVLDARPPPPTLAQKLGIISMPEQLLNEAEWKAVKESSNNRKDSFLPCVICKEDFAMEEQVLLSCSHVFHKACLRAFERFSGKKCCPMCRKEQYQTRLIHEGSKCYKHKCASRKWYLNLRKTVPPNDPQLRKKFFAEKLSAITERMISAMDYEVNNLLFECDQNLEKSRAVFQQFDFSHQVMSDGEWDVVLAKASDRGDSCCPICLAAFADVEPTHKVQKQRKLTILSCSHLFHSACVDAFEQFSVDRKFSCPVCRCTYSRKDVDV